MLMRLVGAFKVLVVALFLMAFVVQTAGASCAGGSPNEPGGCNGWCWILTGTYCTTKVVQEYRDVWVVDPSGQGNWERRLFETTSCACELPKLTTIDRNATDET